MVIGIIFGALLITGLTVGIITTIVKTQPSLVKENIPEHLGVLNHVPMQPLLSQLNVALDDEYIQQVKLRFLKENPQRSEDEFEWLLFELKRYFLVANILKKAPMFSEDIDEISHEMILFTKYYQSFSEGFLGEMLHHIPNTDSKPAPQDRAFFDWIFSQLFQITEFSWKTWGSFFNHPLSGETLKEFKESSIEEFVKAKLIKD
ncbi:hypothetical protein [Bacillus sp. SA1-12]|uniref:hypothetical protein n=1 Tax=Bacillus sp. SA1-12 TaxID=1455638 RepID=UPI000696FC26|nr:hypothetical protein [Bacillus sp. SA1-12]